MRRMKMAAAIVVAVAVLAGAFWWLDFRIAQSDTGVSSQVSTYSSQSAKEMLLAQPVRQVNLRVEGQSDVSDALATELRKDMTSRGLLSAGDVAAQHMDNVLVIEVPEQVVRWTGVYSQARVRAVAAFSTNGDVSWRTRLPVQFYSTAPAVMILGEYQMEDTTRGLISRKGYATDLGRRLATEIGKSLAAELARQAS